MTTKDAFMLRISKQIQQEQEYGNVLDEGKRRLAVSKYLVPLPAVVLVIWAAVSTLRGISPVTVLLLWIVGSFFIYMFYFFLMMIPSLGSDSSLHLTDGSSQIHIREFLRLANLLRTVRKNTVTFLEIFWNAFLINAKPLAKGFALIYMSVLVCAVLLFIQEVISAQTLILITAQVVVILAFYTKISLAEPDTPGFFAGRALAEEKTGESEASKLKLWLYISFFMMFTGLLIIGAMLFPGLTLTRYVSQLSFLPSEFPILLVLVLITQGFVLRYFQGVESRELMQTLNARHLSVLKDDLLPRVQAADPADLDELRREFLLLSMNKLMVQEFFKRFPAYTLVPNLLLIADPAAREILDRTGDEKSIRDIL